MMRRQLPARAGALSPQCFFIKYRMVFVFEVYLGYCAQIVSNVCLFLLLVWSVDVYLLVECVLFNKLSSWMVFLLWVCLKVFVWSVLCLPSMGENEKLLYTCGFLPIIVSTFSNLARFSFVFYWDRNHYCICSGSAKRLFWFAKKYGFNILIALNKSLILIWFFYYDLKNFFKSIM